MSGLETQIARLHSSLHDHLGTDLDAIVGPADVGKEVNELGGLVGAMIAVLAGGVVARERVMIVVKALARREPRHELVLDRFDAHVETFGAPHVRQTVHRERRLQRDHVAKHAREKERVHRVLIPTVDFFLVVVD